MNYLLIIFFLLTSNAFAEKLIVKMRPADSGFYKAAITLATTKALNDQIIVIDGDYNEISQRPEVEYVEKNMKFHVMGYKTSASNEAWGISKIQAQKMWEKGYKGKGIKVAVIDTGVDGTHPELVGKVLPGFNAIDGSANAMDDMGHGTHCSGTIAGNTVGVAPEAKIVPVKFLDKNGAGDLEGAVKAIEWASNQEVQILSNSWGGGGFSQALFDVLKAASDKGIIITAAAGNETNDNDKHPSYPASYKIKNIIGVAATDQSDKIASFSNWGARSVLIAAPGVDIYSSLPGGKYEAWSGTSMATPHVSGAIALLLEAGCQNVFLCLDKNQVKVPGLKKKVMSSGRLEFN